MRFKNRAVASCPSNPEGRHDPVRVGNGEPAVLPFYRIAKNTWLSISVCAHCGLVFSIEDAILNESEEADEVDRQLSELERDMKNQQSEPGRSEPEPSARGL